MTVNYSLKVQNLSVSFGPLAALKDITVEIPARGITAIIGPSGCGKSTLLRAMNRLAEQSDGASISGRIILGDEDIYHPSRDVTTIRKKMGLLSQRPYPLPMSIYENVAYGPRLHGMKGRRNIDGIVRH